MKPTRNLDGYLQLMGDRRRRQTVQYLRRDDEGMATIDELVDWIDPSSTVPNGRTSARDRLAIQLYHAHLPKLADHGVVEFDADHRSVRYRPNEQFEAVMDALPDEASVIYP